MKKIVKATGFDELKKTPKLNIISQTSTCCASGTRDSFEQESTCKETKESDKGKTLDSFLKLQKSLERAA